MTSLQIDFDDIFPSNAKLQHLNYELQDYLSDLEISIIIATDASDNKASVGIFSPLSWSFAIIRLPDYTHIFIAELLLIVLALRNLLGESIISCRSYRFSVSTFVAFHGNKYSYLKCVTIFSPYNITKNLFTVNFRSARVIL